MSIDKEFSELSTQKSTKSNLKKKAYGLAAYGPPSKIVRSKGSLLIVMPILHAFEFLICFD